MCKRLVTNLACKPYSQRRQQRGDDLTINVELDDIRNGKQLWGEQYNRKVADLLAVQSDIAREVPSVCAHNFRWKITEAAKGSTDNPEAYRLYLKGKYYTNKLTKEGFDRASTILIRLSLSIPTMPWLQRPGFQLREPGRLV